MKSLFNIKKNLVRALSDVSQRFSIAEVRIGLTYTAVLLDNGELGLAYTFLDRIPRGCIAFPDKNTLLGRQSTELLEILQSPRQLDRAVGLAAVNALASSVSAGYFQGDSRKTIDIRKNDTVGMVGHFEPLVAEIKSRAEKLLIFEIEDKLTEGFFPAHEALTALPTCDVAIITATSIVNDTIDALLQSCVNCREVVILGASTPMNAEAFEDTLVTLLSGLKVTDIDLVMRVISEGGGMRKFKKGVQKINLRIERAST